MEDNDIFHFFTIYWILNISYAKNLTKQNNQNTPLKDGVLSRKNYLKTIVLCLIFTVYMSSLKGLIS